MIKNPLQRTRKNMMTNPVEDLVQGIASTVTVGQNKNERFGNMALSLEGISEQDATLLDNRVSEINTVLSSMLKNGSVALENISEHAIAGATAAGILATAPRTFLSSKLQGINGVDSVINASVADAFNDRPLSLEAYDERANRDAQTYSIAYNLLALTQDPFGETLFPTIVINPTEVGVLIANTLYYVYNDFKRSVTGALAQYGRMSVIRAYADSEILKNEQTRAIPVLRTGGGAEDNSAMFAPVTEVPTRTVRLGGGLEVTTTAMRVDERYDAIGISQTNELLNSGLMGPSDNLDAYAKLQTIYLRVTGSDDKVDVIALNTDHLPSALFTYAVQGNTRRMVLNLDSDGIVLPVGTTKANGAALEVLTELATHQVRLHLSVSGSVYLDKGEAIINRGVASLVTARTAVGATAPAATLTAISNKLKSAELVYHDTELFRANSNIRQRTQLLDKQTEHSIIQVPYRSPIAAIAPVMNVNGGAPVGSVVQDLVNLTSITVHNEAVGALTKVAATLKGYLPIPDATGRLPELSYIGHHYVIPTYFEEAIVLEDTVDSLVSHERLKDIRTSMIERVRYYANEMYRKSEYQAAAQVLTGNVGYRPVVIVATDPVIANYLNSDGVFQSLGDQFEVKVVSSIDKRMKDQMFVTFGVFDANRNTSVNPLNSGNLFIAPEIVTELPVTRDGGTSNEAIVTPRFLHTWHLPVMTKITVTGLQDVIGKVAINTKEV